MRARTITIALASTLFLSSCGQQPPPETQPPQAPPAAAADAPAATGVATGGSSASVAGADPCALLTADEVKAATGYEVSGSAAGSSCTYTGRADARMLVVLVEVGTDSGPDLDQAFGLTRERGEDGVIRLLQGDLLDKLVYPDGSSVRVVITGEGVLRRDGQTLEAMQKPRFVDGRGGAESTLQDVTATLFRAIRDKRG